MTPAEPDVPPVTDAPLALDPEALIRSDNPWDWLLASFLGLGEEADEKAVKPNA